MKPISSMKAGLAVSDHQPGLPHASRIEGPCRQLPGRGTSPEKLPAGGGHRAMALPEAMNAA